MDGAERERTTVGHNTRQRDAVTGQRKISGNFICWVPRMNFWSGRQSSRRRSWERGSSECSLGRTRRRPGREHREQSKTTGKAKRQAGKAQVYRPRITFTSPGHVASPKVKKITHQQWHVVAHHQLHDGAQARALREVDEVLQTEREADMLVQLDAHSVAVRGCGVVVVTRFASFAPFGWSVALC